MQDHISKIRELFGRVQQTQQSTPVQKKKLSNSLQQTLIDFNSHHARSIAASNPRTSAAVLTRLAADKIPAIRQRVAENPNTPPAVLRQLAHDSESEVRLAISENPNATHALLNELALDASPDVRYGIASNPHIPVYMLSHLEQDENPYVAVRAQHTIDSLHHSLNPASDSSCSPS